MEAFEVLRPDVRVEENVLIDVIRNPSAPIFSSNFYTTAIPESVAQGTSVLGITASDADGVSTSTEDGGGGWWMMGVATADA